MLSTEGCASGLSKDSDSLVCKVLQMKPTPPFLRLTGNSAIQTQSDHDDPSGKLNEIKKLTIVTVCHFALV